MIRFHNETLPGYGENFMLDQWLSLELRQEKEYKFKVIDISERIEPAEEVISYLARCVLVAHISPIMLKAECEILLEDAEDAGLDQLRGYIKDSIIPNNRSTVVGDFGEVLGAQILMVFEHFSLPIFKLRYREKKDWAMRLMDLCLIRSEGLDKPLICYGEVKTRSKDCELNIGCKGHDSLTKGDILQNAEILQFIARSLYESSLFEEARFISKIRLGKIDYDYRHDLFIIHNRDKWQEEILDRLNNHNLSDSLLDFSVKVALITDLSELIDTVYDHIVNAAREVINE